MYNIILKRIIDCAFSLIVLTALLPLLIFLTVLIAILMRGNPFFLQNRPGKQCHIFSVIKFKTMNDARDEKRELLPDAQRLTKVGAFLRKTSLDEVPQLINVLKGDMSLIGPRPLLIQYLPYYSKRENKRHLVRPGITGLAQISGRSKLGWDERLELDVQYVESISALNDFKIFLKTIKNVLARKDISVVPDAPDLNKQRELKLNDTPCQQTNSDDVHTK